MKKNVSTIEYLIKTGKEMYDELSIELNRATLRYGAESKQAQEIEKKIIRVVVQLDKLTCTSDIRSICI